MSHFSGSHSPVTGEPQPKSLYTESASSTPTPTPPNGKPYNLPYNNSVASKSDFFHRRHTRAFSTPISTSPIRVNHESSPVADSPISKADHQRSRSRSNSRPLSMVQTYQAPLMDVNEDTIPELQPIFSFLNSHGNKLYQEGYFLKLDDQNTQGKPNSDRTWTECFAQLVGTVLSLWDAAELDAAGEDGEVLPKFLNLTDASIKMIESLPTRSNEEQPLQNILSISTAGRNRYLLHFNSRHSLMQWTAGIRLAMFEHSTLQEAYTGALIAGKGKTLNNIGVIMERSRMPVDQWVRVRFGAGVPWRRCWCVVSPPDEKEYQKVIKEHKKRSPYDRSHPPVLKGDIKFYDTRKEGKKQKKMQPIATISDAYSAYALYPQAKSLIEASTLVKIEGQITIHSDPPSSTEGFVFIMPEVHPAVSGFEMMLRFLFPTWDTFGLYGRPGRLVASVLDSRSLMFAMPKHKRYGYLEILDVSSLILADGSSGWSERDWRKKMKELTGTRMSAADEADSTSTIASRTNSHKKRLSFGPAAGGAGKPRVGFAENGQPSVRTSRSMSLNSRPDVRDASAPAATRGHAPSPLAGKSGHSRNASDPHLAGPMPPQPPPHGDIPYSASPVSGRGQIPARAFVNDLAATPERVSSDEERMDTPVRDFDGMRRMPTPEPVAAPPEFAHAPGDKPTTRPHHAPEMRRANSRLSITTLQQLAKAGGVPVGQEAWGNESERSSEERHGSSNGQHGPHPVHLHANNVGMSANAGSREALVENAPRSPGLPPPGMRPNGARSKSPQTQAMGPPPPQHRGPSPGPRPKTPSSRPGTASENRPPPHPMHAGPPPGMMPPGRGGPPSRGRGNMPPQGRGYPPQDMYGGYQQGPPGRGGPGPRSPPGRGGPLPPLHTSASIHRKPLPVRSDSLQSRGTAPPTASTSSGSFTGNRIDASGYGQIHPHNTGSRGPPHPGMRRQDTGQSQSSSRYDESSRYDDGASTASPDYASSRPSTETASSVERPRAGVLRTTGHADDSPTHPAGPNFDIPNIDFGPTVNYASAQASMPPPPRSFSPAQRSQSPARMAPRSHSPAPMAPRSHSPAPLVPRKSPGPDGQRSRQVSDEGNQNRRSVIWQPATTMGGSPNPATPGLTPEEYVQQRAAQAAATPLYAHRRHSSGNTLQGYQAGASTPPLARAPGQEYFGTAHSRNSSQDLLQRPNSRNAGDLLQRPNSRELLQRPGSRGAGAVLGGQQSSGEAHLSAREQEHVARVTGTPLINMAGSRNGPQAGGGLVGAIEAREREKQQMKAGWGSAAAQNAINQRQQQAAYQQFSPPMTAVVPSGMPSPGLPPPSGMYSNMARGTGVPPSPRGQFYGAPSPQFEQQGSWSPGSGGFRSPPAGQFDPRFMPPQGQGHFSPPPQQFPPAQSPPSGQRGPGQYPYHGQAF
ncbi:hypothetical protein F5Y15DRAFT_259174 [Xylariaceae sp. FL0016]|nr:hypothetical protein F5Y15DRAFT_259174 [Xylariaceae sp. FL0016]